MRIPNSDSAELDIVTYDKDKNNAEVKGIGVFLLHTACINDSKWAPKKYTYLHDVIKVVDRMMISKSIQNC